MDHKKANHRTTRSSIRKVHFPKTINGCIRVLANTQPVDGSPGKMLLAELVDHPLHIGRLRHKAIQKLQCRNITLAQRMEPVAYLFAAAITAVDLEIILVVSDTERPLPGFEVIH